MTKVFLVVAMLLSAGVFFVGRGGGFEEMGLTRPAE